MVTFRLDPEIDSYRIEYFDHERPAELNKLFEAPVQPVDDLNYDVALDDLKSGEIHEISLYEPGFIGTSSVKFLT